MPQQEDHTRNASRPGVERYAASSGFPATAAEDLRSKFLIRINRHLHRLESLVLVLLSSLLRIIRCRNHQLLVFTYWQSHIRASLQLESYDEGPLRLISSHNSHLKTQNNGCPPCFSGDRSATMTDADSKGELYIMDST